MEPQHFNVKLRVQDPAPGTLEALIPVFHGWIQEHACPEQLVDVADYSHVPAGPGVVLIGHEADYSLDGAGHRWGVRYNRKAEVPGGTQERLAQAARAALDACRRLERDASLGGRIRFDGRAIELFVNDRLLAPNTAATRAALEPELKRFCDRLLGGAGYTLAFESEPRRLFGVTVTAAAAVSAEQLLANLGA